MMALAASPRCLLRRDSVTNIALLSYYVPVNGLRTAKSDLNRNRNRDAHLAAASFSISPDLHRARYTMGWPLGPGADLFITM